MTLEDSEVHKGLGNEYFSNQDYISALTEYTEAIVLNRNNSILYSNRAATFLKLESWQNAVKDCDQGLSLSDSSNNSNKKIIVKLLWRKAIALRNLGNIDSAKSTISSALKIEPNNQELLTENGIIESLGEKVAKKAKIEPINVRDEVRNTEEVSKVNSITKNENKNENTSITPIQIEYVDKIPDNFFVKEVLEEVHVVKRSYVKEEPTKGKKPIITEVPKIQEVINKTSPGFNYDDLTFPQYPSVQFLISLKDNSSKDIQKYYIYILSIPVLHYQNIFKVTGVEPYVLDLFLESSNYVLENDITEYHTKITDLLITFKQLPRFDLTSMFADSKKTHKLKELFESKLNLNFNDYWN
ncbi:hypothetical protein DAPK24_027880 [Pichia kluyveri]|uniref:RNA polymerase II-associated protein 3 n=1 Tax=Pichia kluyveri TaxID=36015 RepID=A0AAV5R5T7_PICKL|nr:hypothetical protein DAPK24_027880 [Pichia kluyveri]